MRVRSLNMNDAHIYCTEEQFAAEFNAVNEMYLKYFKIFGIEKYVMRFSTHDPSRMSGDKAKFVNEPELWKKTEDMVRETLEKSGINYKEVSNEAAFYGPKIDVQVWSVIGREFTLATNQVDFALPGEIRPGLSRQGQHGQDAALHPSRAAGHARAVHRFFDRALRGQFPALAGAGASACPDHRRRGAAGRLQQVHRERTARRLRAGGGGLFEQQDQRQDSGGGEGAGPYDAGDWPARFGKPAPSPCASTAKAIGAKPKAEAVAEIVAAIRERRA